MLRFRSAFPAFSFEAKLTIENKENNLMISWEKDGFTGTLRADLKTAGFAIEGINEQSIKVYEMNLFYNL